MQHKITVLIVITNMFLADIFTIAQNKYVKIRNHLNLVISRARVL